MAVQILLHNPTLTDSDPPSVTDDVNYNPALQTASFITPYGITLTIDYT